MRATPLILLVVTLAAVGVGCGGVSDSDPDVLDGAEPGTAIATLERVGGSVPMEFELTRVPDVVVYADGGVLAARDQGAFSRLELADHEFQELVRDLDDADLGRFPSDVEALDGATDVVDADAVVVTVRLDEEHRISAYALGLEGVRYPEPVEAVVARLQQLAERAHVEGARWIPEHGRLFVTGPASPEVPAQPWPEELPVPDDLANTSFEDPATLVLEEGKVEVAATIFAEMPTQPLVAPDGRAYVVSWRPLLPHEAAAS